MSRLDAAHALLRAPQVQWRLPPERGAAGESRMPLQPLFNAEELVEFRYALAAAAEPVLMWPAPVATVRSAMKVSSVSPDRWETSSGRHCAPPVPSCPAFPSPYRSGSA